MKLLARKATLTLLAAVVVSMIFSLAFTMPANASSATPVLSTEPGSRTFSVGDTFQVHIMITDAFDLYGYQFKLYFDTSVLKALDLSPHDGSSDEFGFFHTTYKIWNYRVENDVGYVGIAVTPPLGTKQGESGSGILATVDFEAVGTGRTKLTFNSAKLTETDASSIDHIEIGGVITVGEVTDIPIADAGGPYRGVKGEAVEFNAWGSSDPNGYIVSYDWDFGDDSTGSGMVVDHTYSAEGLYKVTLTVTDNEGYTDTSEATVEIAKPAESSAPPTSDNTAPIVPPANVDTGLLSESTLQQLRANSIGISAVFAIVIGLVLLKRPAYLRPKPKI